MRPALRLTLGGLAVLLALPAGIRSAYAHGGQYRGPAGEVPPDSRTPHDPPPPDTGTGTPTPPDTGPNGDPTPPPNDGGDTPTPTPDSNTPDPNAPDGPVPPVGPGKGPQTGTRKLPSKRNQSFDSWLFWWNYNKDGILELRRTMRGGARTGGANLGDMAEAGSATVGVDQDITARAVESRVVPFLKGVAADGKLNFDIQASGVLGLAKLGRHETLPLLFAMAENKGPDQVHKVVEETAALSLGVLQDQSPAVRDFLRGRIADGSAKTRTRCFAAYSLGLLGSPEGAADPRDLAALLAAASDETEASGDLSAAALSAMGHLGDPAALPHLLAFVAEEKAGARRLDDVRLASAASALGRLGRPGLSGPASREVVDSLKSLLRRKNRLARYSAVIALGQVAPAADEVLQAECLTHLSTVLSGEGKGSFDNQAANFALVAMGRIAAAPACPEAVRARAIDRLKKALDARPSQRSFAALGLGLAGMNAPEAVRADAAYAVRTALGLSTGDVENRGALCISVGLLRDIQSAGLLGSFVRDAGLDPRLRGTAALALGLMGERSSVDSIRAALVERGERELRVDAALAAGLLRDGKAVDALVTILKDPKSSQVVLGSVASALGRIGDQRAVDPLLEIAGNANSMVLARALACTALGQIGDRGDVPVLSRLSEDVNYRASYDALGEVLSIL